MKISVIFATLGGERRDAFENAVKSLGATTGEHDVEVIAIVDGDEFLVEKTAFWLGGNYVIDFSFQRRGALRCWNRGLELSTGDIIVPAGDDQIFHPGWLDYALESHRDKLDNYGVVGMNDLAYNGNTQVATMYLFDRRYCKDIMGGVLAPPVYSYFCVDLEWNEKAKMLGRFYWDSRAVVEHLHSAHGKRPVDKLDLEKADKNWMEIDNAIFAERKAEEFPIRWEPII